MLTWREEGGEEETGEGEAAGIHVRLVCVMLGDCFSWYAPPPMCQRAVVGGRARSCPALGREGADMAGVNVAGRKDVCWKSVPSQRFWKFGCAASAVSIYLAPSSTRPRWVLTDRVSVKVRRSSARWLGGLVSLCGPVRRPEDPSPI